MDGQSPVILSIDTSTPCTTVALTSGIRLNGKVLGSFNLNGNVTHSRRLIQAIDILMEGVSIDWEGVDGIGVSLGPGSFTGLRIGLATAKGLAAAAERPLLGVSTLDSLAAKCATADLICAVLDARKKEVYAGLYRCNRDGESEVASEPVVIDPVKLCESLDEQVFMIGDGAALYSEIIKDSLGDKVVFAPSCLNVPTADSLGFLCGEKLLDNNVLDLASAAPLYVRATDAELNLGKKNKARM